MQDTPLSKLIELVSFDQQFLALQHEMQTLQASVDVDNHEMEQCRAALYRAQEHVSITQKKVDAQELEMQVLNDQEKEKRKRLDNVANQREYQSLMKEIEQLNERQQNLEQDLLAAWKDLERAQQDHKSKQDFCDIKITSLDASIIAKMKTIEEYAQKIKEYEQERERKKATIAPEFLAKYETMSHQVSNPIVQVKQESCSACFYKVTQQDLADLKRGKLLQCKDCFRLLYYAPQ